MFARTEALLNTISTLDGKAKTQAFEQLKAMVALQVSNWPENVITWVQLAKVYALGNDHKSAIAALNSIKNAGKDAGTVSSLYASYLLQVDLDPAEIFPALLEQIAVLNSCEAKYQGNAQQCLGHFFHMTDPSRARKYFLRAYEIEKRQVELNWKPYELKLIAPAGQPFGKFNDKETSLISLKGGCITGEKGCVTRKNKLFVGDKTAFSFNNEYKSIKRLKGITLGAVYTNPANYFHWLIETCSRVAVMKEKYDQILLARHFETEKLMKCLKVEMNKIVWYDSNVQYRCDELRLVEFPSTNQDDTWDCYVPSKYALMTLNRKAPKPTQNLIIYIARTKGIRRVINQALLYKALPQAVIFHGSSVTWPDGRTEKLDVLGQMNLFASASVVLGPHGAGFANVVWCQPGTTVIEFPLYNRVNRNFEYLSRALNLRYIAWTEITSRYHGNFTLTEESVRNLSLEVNSCRVE